MRSALQNFFATNLVLVLFVYGLSFFGMGLAIAATRLSRRYKPIKLDKGIKWLAAFGFAHGLHEWGTMFIPIQATYIHGYGVIALQMLHVLLLAASFGFLFQFGIELLDVRWPYLTFVPLAILLAWTLISFLPAFIHIWYGTPWNADPSIWARYGIGFPAGIVAAYGLYDYAEGHLQAPGMRSIYISLQIAGATLAAYAFLGGLVVSPGPFFPANWLNTAQIVKWFGVPIYAFRALDGLLLAGSIINVLKVFDIEIEQHLEQMEIKQNIAKERERIARELHDNTIQSIYAAGLLIESARLKLDADDNTTRQLESAVHNLNEAIASLRSYIGDLRPIVTDVDLIQGIRAQIADLKLASLVNVHLDLSLPSGLKCNAARTPHILAVVREALSNTVRHAHGKNVTIRASCVEKRLVLSVEDDGRGFRQAETERGFGLRNMRDRARLLGGKLMIESAMDQGTKVTLIVPLEETR